MMRTWEPQRLTPARAALMVLLALAIIGVFIAIIFFATDGSKRGLALGVLIAVLPIAVYVAIKRPFIFPFGLFVLLVPFDTILRLPHFGTITKLVALCSGLAFIFLLVRNKRHVRPNRATLLWVSLLVWMALSIFWAIDPVEAASKLATYAQLIALYLIVSLMPISEDDHKGFLSIVAISGILAAAYAVYLYHTGAFVQYAQFEGVASSRLLVRFGEDKLDPNAFSAAFLLPISIIMTWALQRRPFFAKVALIGGFILLVGGMYVNGSRGALVALAALVAYMLLRGRFKAQLLTISVVALVGSFFLPTSPWARFANAAATGGAGRVSIWKVGFEAFRHHWLTGVGTGMFPFAYDKSFILVYQPHNEFWHRASHNMLLEFAVELGVVGLILLLVAWYTQFRSLHAIDRSDPLFDIKIALEGAVVAMFVASLFLGTMSLKSTWLLFEAMAVTGSLVILRLPLEDRRLNARANGPYGPQYLERAVFQEPINA